MWATITLLAEHKKTNRNSKDTDLRTPLGAWPSEAHIERKNREKVKVQRENNDQSKSKWHLTKMLKKIFIIKSRQNS